MPAQYIPSTPFRPQGYVSPHAPDEPKPAQTFCSPSCPVGGNPDYLMCRQKYTVLVYPPHKSDMEYGMFLSACLKMI